jgi:hypothetical protein
MEKKAGIEADICATAKCLAAQCCVKKDNAGAGSDVNNDDFKKEDEGGVDVKIIAVIAVVVLVVVAAIAAVVVGRGKRSVKAKQQQSSVTRMSMVNGVEMGGGMHQQQYGQNPTSMRV